MAAVAGQEQRCPHPGCEEHGSGVDDTAWRRAFEEAWPAVERRLRQILRARGVPRSEREDYLQEVAARAVARHVPFHGAADLLPWASTVLRRLHAENARRAERLRAAEERLPRGRAPDPATAVVAKLDLDRIAETLSSWTAFDRDALFGRQEVPTTGRSARTATGASYVRRHRLRAKLLTAIDGMAGVLGAGRRLRLHLLRSPEVSQAASALVAPVAMACAALALPFVPFGADPGQGRDPNVVSLESATSAAASGTQATAQAGASVDPAGLGSPSGGGEAAAGTGDRRPPSRAPRPIPSPVEQRVGVKSGDQSAYVEVENNRVREPFLCVWVAAGVPETCTEQPGGTIESPVRLPW